MSVLARLPSQPTPKKHPLRPMALRGCFLESPKLLGFFLWRRLGNSLFEANTWLELRNGCRSNFDRLARTWVFTSACSTLAGREGSETHQSYGVAFCNGAFDRIQSCIQCPACSRFGNFAASCNCFDQFCFIQVVLQFICAFNARKPAWLAKVAKIMADVFKNVGRIFATLNFFGLKWLTPPIFH